MTDLTRRAVLAGIAAAATAGRAEAQAFPQAGRPINLVVPFAAGGTTDVSARVVAGFLERDLGVPVQVINRPGATTQIGNAEVARAKPDGHTIGLLSLPSLAMTYLDAERKAPYTRASFTPIAHVVADANLLVVPSGAPHRGVPDLLAAARAAPKRLRVGTGGLMSNTHLAGVALERTAGVQFAFVHFNGGAPVVTALLGGNIDAAINGTQTTIPHARSGAFRVIATMSDARSPFFPEAPTLIEQGIDVISPSSFALLGPAEMPAPIVDALAAATSRALANEEVARRLSEFALAGSYMAPAALAAFWGAFETRQRPLIDLARQ